MYALSRQPQMAQYFTYDSRVFDTGYDPALVITEMCCDYLQGESVPWSVNLPCLHEPHHGPECLWLFQKLLNLSWCSLSKPLAIDRDKLFRIPNEYATTVHRRCDVLLETTVNKPALPLRLIQVIHLHQVGLLANCRPHSQMRCLLLNNWQPTAS